MNDSPRFNIRRWPDRTLLAANLSAAEVETYQAAGAITADRVVTLLTVDLAGRRVGEIIVSSADGRETGRRL